MKIRQYKGYEITYNKKDKHFHAKRDNDILEPENTEQDLIRKIDHIQEIKEKEAKQVEHNKTIKMLADAKFKVDAVDFRYFCECISSFNNEALIMFEDGKFSSVMLDPANVCMVEMRVPAECNQKIKHFKFAVSISHLAKLLRGIVNKGKLILGFDFSVMKINIENSFGLFNFPMLEIFEQTKTIPEMSFSHKFEMRATDFQYFMKCSDKVAESVLFCVKDKKLNFVATGGEQMYMSPSFKQEGDDTKSKYSIEYLRKMKFKGKLLFEFKKDYPIRISDENGNKLILAPRVSNDD
jgi:DNA polymerase III sliding clamp (beta) subunit (PCNA family)